MSEESQQRKQALIERAKEEMALNPNASFKEVADKMDVPYMMLYTLLRRAGVKLVPGQKIPNVLKKIEKLIAAGKTSIQIRQELGISKQYLHNLKVKFNLEIPGRPTENVEKISRMEELFQRGYTAHQVHIRTGFSKKYVYAYAHARMEKKG